MSSVGILLKLLTTLGKFPNYNFPSNYLAAVLLENSVPIVTVQKKKKYALNLDIKCS